MTPVENNIQQHIDQFLRDNDISALYETYEWKGDAIENDFPDLFRLELEISTAARNHSLGIGHLIDIAKWGKLPNTKQISWQKPSELTLYVNDQPAPWLRIEPEKAISKVEGQIRGFGPTYASKLLHFAVPQIFGALDTRLVRTFGKGDTDAQRYPFLNMTVTRSGGRWTILASQPGWADEYGKWIAILNYIAHSLNEKGNRCPHPEKYVSSGLRKDHTWFPADVETALFSYASQEIKRKKE